MSLRAELLRLGIRTFLKRRGHHLDIEAWRSDMRAMERPVPRPPAHIASVEVSVGRLTFHRVTTPASQPEHNVLYLHGGGYVSGAPAHYRRQAGHHQSSGADLGEEPVDVSTQFVRLAAEVARGSEYLRGRRTSLFGHFVNPGDIGGHTIGPLRHQLNVV